MKKMIAFAFVALLALPAVALAQTMTISVDPDGVAGPLEPVQVFDKVLPQFDVLVTMDTGGEASSAAEFVMTEIVVDFPAVFKLGLPAKINDTPLDLGDNNLGEYILAFGGCESYTGSIELVRQGYGDFGGAIGPNSDYVVALRGLQPGDSQPSSFNGELGFVDCQDNKFVVQMGGTDGGVTGSGATFPDGGVIINATPIVVANEAATMGQLKARF